MSISTAMASCAITRCVQSLPLGLCSASESPKHAIAASNSRLSVAHSNKVEASSCIRGAKYACFGQFSSLAGTNLVTRSVSPLPRVAPRRQLMRIVAEDKPDVLRAVGFLVKVGKDGLDAGTNLVPETVPRGIARIGVGVVGAVVVSYLLRSIFSTALFILAIGGLSYLAYLYISKDSDGGGGSSGKPRNTDDSLEEARRIMEKYK